MTRETVPTPTPASCATLAMVVTPPAPPRGTASNPITARLAVSTGAHVPVRMLARHGSCELVARRRPLPDLPPLLRRRQRRWDRRPARHHGAPGPPRVARDRRHLAQPELPFAERGLGLRRQRLQGRAPGPRHAGGPRRADRRG